MKFYIPFLFVSLPLLFMIFPLSSRHRRRRRCRRWTRRQIYKRCTYEYGAVRIYVLNKSCEIRTTTTTTTTTMRGTSSALNLRPRFAPQRNGIYDTRNLSAVHKKTRSPRIFMVSLLTLKIS